MLALESNHQAPSTQDSPSSQHASTSTSNSASLDRTELDDLLDELLGQAATRTRAEHRRTRPGSLVGQACSQTRRPTPQPTTRNDSLSALRLTPPINASQQPLHARLQIDIEVDQRTGSARIDSWSPVNCDSAPVGTGYSNYCTCHRHW